MSSQPAPVFRIRQVIVSEGRYHVCTCQCCSAAIVHLPEDKKSLKKLEDILEVNDIEKVFAAAFEKGE